MKFYCCWTWHIWIVFYVEGCILFSVHLVGVNRLSACREFCGVHSWQNGTRCRDGVNVLCVVPILFGWFLRVPSLHGLVFIWKTFL